MEPSPKRQCHDEHLEVPAGVIIVNLTNNTSILPQLTFEPDETQYMLDENLPTLLGFESMQGVRTFEHEDDAKTIETVRAERLLVLFERYSGILNKLEVDDTADDPMKLLEKGKDKFPGYASLTKMITSLVQAMDLDDSRDEKVNDVVLITTNMFAALREHAKDATVQRKLTTRVKSAVHAFKQRKRLHMNLYQNGNEHLTQLYRMYPQVREISDKTWSSSKVRPYGETARDIVRAIGIVSPGDKRIAHAVTLMMDQYAVLRDQIDNMALRRLFLYRIKQAVSTKPRKRETKRPRPTRFKEEAQSYLQQISTVGCIEPDPIAIELVMDGHAKDNLTCSIESSVSHTL